MHSSSTKFRFTLVFATVCAAFAANVLSGLTESARAQSMPAYSLNPSAETRLSSVGPSQTRAEIRLPASATEQLPESLRDYRTRPQSESPVAASELNHRLAQRQANLAPQNGLYTPVQAQPTNPSTAQPASYEQNAGQQPAASFNDLLTEQAEQMISREGTGSSVKIAILLAALSLAPALILMTTCYVRVVVVLTLLRQAFGAQQLPSTQILTALSLFVTFLVMAPTWNEIKTQAIDPYTQPDSQIPLEDAFARAVIPVKQFMARQITMAKNEESVAMFYRYLPKQTGGVQTPPPTSIEQVPLNVLMPAFLVSELKVAFLLGFQVYLPFLIVDLVVSSVTVSMGMVMLPPTMVSFPLKLILFVMVDGWTLVIGMLMQSFGPL